MGSDELEAGELPEEMAVDGERERSEDRRKDRREERAERERERGGSKDRVDRERDRGRDGRERRHDRDDGRDREKERHREKERESSHRHRERERDHDRGGKDREAGHGRDRGHARGHERDDRERDRDHNRDQDRNKEKSQRRDKEREKPDMEKPDREKGRERESDKGREKDDPRRRDEEVDRDVDDGDRGNDAAVSKTVRKSQAPEKDDTIEVESASTVKLRERLEKAKEERLKEQLEGASEILSWVSKSRKIEDQRNAEKEKALRLKQALDEQDNILAEDDDEDEFVDSAAVYGKDHLAGVKVVHGLDKVLEGGAIVLTLKDQDILAGGDINEEADVLENVEIGEQKRRDEAYRASKKAGKYENKFNEDGSSKGILSQYDDPIDDEGVILDEGGQFSAEAEKRLEELRRRIQGGSVQKVPENLSSSVRISSDFYTSDEMLQFKKPKKKKSLRKKEKLDLDALEAEAVAAGLGIGDMGSRNDPKRRAAMEEQEKAEAEKRSNAYQKALLRAEEKTKALREESSSTLKSGEDEDLVFGDDYEDLHKSVEQARKLALSKQNEEAPSGPQAVALLATASKEQETLSPNEEGQESKVVISELEEFVWGLQMNEDTRKVETEDVFMDEDDAPKFDKLDENGVDMVDTKESANIAESPQNDEKEVVEPDEVIHEVPVGKGLGAVLKLLKDRGTLNEGTEWGGRTTDKKKSKLVGIEDGPREIRIERLDEFGRIMTPKEAFRMISHKFHGKGPGKMKQEKRMKKFQEELKTKQMKSSDTPLMSAEKMRETQARMQTPYLVITGHVKPGQTSDPKSGFATVEKDHLGSLTPMLGDKKVEHFLGISRRPEPGSMGPPPPKKPKTN